MKTTTQIPPRPIFARYLWRKHCMSQPMDPPTKEEIEDAYLVLEECDPPVWDVDELLLAEARITLGEC